MTLSIYKCVQLACTWEATARKAGNVHPGRRFADLCYDDFVQSAAAIAPILDEVHVNGVGRTVLEAIRATRAVVSSNTNLGIVLLLTPLAAVPREQTLCAGIGKVLAELPVDDSRLVFEAIRLAQPGGLGDAPDQDVAAAPTLPLRQIMAMAADRDLVARQYANDYREVFECGVPALVEGYRRFGNFEEAIVFAHLTLLSICGDSLILRKRGPAEADLASRNAREVLDAGWPTTDAGRAAFASFDAWLTADGNARNPGASADLVTACLFADFRENGDRREAPRER